jgi:hypothetical protein
MSDPVSFSRFPLDNFFLVPQFNPSSLQNQVS